MEPISVAMAAFAAVKSGVKLGKDAHSLYKDVAKCWGAIEQVKGAHNKKKKSIRNKIMSVEEEAMETFVAKKQAEDLEKQLREIIIYTRGMSGWQELLRLRAEISRKRREEEAAARRAREQNIEYAMIAAGCLGIAVAIGWIVWLVLQSR